MAKTRSKGFKADYGGAGPEQVAKALHAHRPDGADEIVSVEIKADRAGVPVAQLASLRASGPDRPPGT